MPKETVLRGKKEKYGRTNLRLEGATLRENIRKSSADIRLYYYQSDRGLPGATIFYNTDGFSKQRLDENTFFVQAHYENALSQLWSIQANAKYNRGYVHYLDPTYLGSEGKIGKQIYTKRTVRIIGCIV